MYVINTIIFSVQTMIVSKMSCKHSISVFRKQNRKLTICILSNHVDDLFCLIEVELMCLCFMCGSHIVVGKHLLIVRYYFVKCVM